MQIAGRSLLAAVKKNPSPSCNECSIKESRHCRRLKGFFFAANYKLRTTGYFTGASMGS